MIQHANVELAETAVRCKLVRFACRSRNRIRNRQVIPDQQNGIEAMGLACSAARPAARANARPTPALANIAQARI